jgi:hypothetical protein
VSGPRVTLGVSRRRALFTALAVGACSGALLGGGPAMAAVSSVQSGWWNEASAGGISAPSTTPSNDLQVSNGLQGPLSFAAVRFTLPSGTPGSADVSLDLTIPSGSASDVGTPAVSACPTTGAWKPGGDQPASTKPGYDCTGGKEANGVVASGGGSETWTFPASWASGSTVSVALVPTAGTQTPFAVEYQDPTAASVSVLGPSAAGAAPTATQPLPGQSPSPAAVQPSGASAGGSPVAQGPISGSSAPGATPVGPGTATLGAGAGVAPSFSGLAAGNGSSPSAQPAALPHASAAPASEPPSAESAAAAKPSDRAARIMAVCVLVLTGLALFFLAGRPSRPARKLGAFASAADGPGGMQPALVGGLGRFARARFAPPKRI